MRLIIAALLLAACHHDALREDLDVFCSADGLKHAGPLNEFGPWYEPKVSSEVMKHELDHLKDGTLTFIPEWKALMTKHLGEAGIASCATFGAMFEKKP